MCRYVCSVCRELIVNNHEEIPGVPNLKMRGLNAILALCLHPETIGGYCGNL